MKNFVIIGAGGFGQEAGETAKRIDESDSDFRFIGYIDDNKELHKTFLNEVPILGDLNWINDSFNEEDLYFMCSIGDTIIKKEVGEKALDKGYTPFSIIHPSVIIRYGVKIGDGVTIGPGTVVAPNVHIKNNVIVNQVCSLGHNDVINDYCTISPLSAISGGVVLGEGVYFGTGASILQYINIGEFPSS
ncbi:hypothetical protein LCGC14_0630120 [marine sediment metagenome]|uniref:PglD N-terminal domain-containing protein n=1 Tax=marine sediment metagenome TaxID=412755 RepID=A0A0F9UAP7_9ZZZZ|nr:transferase [archaeon]